MDEFNYSAHTSIYVAPLRIDKLKRKSINTARRPTSRTRTNSRDSSLDGSSRSHREITPPATPRTSQDSLDRGDCSPSFPSFLRAFYPFLPTFTDGTSTVTLPLKVGDVILVHTIHTNGWADGTLLSSGARGWLPTNYCEGYETIHIKLLLRACLNLFEQLRLGPIGSVRNSQVAITTMVAGVRHLLESTECLTREAHNVISSERVRKARKALLTELSGLVKAAKQFSGQPGQSTSEHGDDITNELILRSFKIVLRGVRFLDVWYDQYEISSNCMGNHNTVGHLDSAGPYTPPLAHTGVDSSRTSSDSGKDAPVYFGSQSSEARNQHQLSHPLPSTPNLLSPRSTSPAISPNTTISNGAEPATSGPVYALARLHSSQDLLLSYLGSYIGRIHHQAVITPQLQATQRQAVCVAQDIIAVVEIMLMREPKAGVLQRLKTAMHHRFASLISAANDVISNGINAGFGDEEVGVMMVDGGRSLIAAATECVKAAGECAEKAKFAIEQIGDFEMEPISLGIGLGITTDLVEPSPVDSQPTVSSEDNGNETDNVGVLQSKSQGALPAPLLDSTPEESMSVPALKLDTNVRPASAIVPSPAKPPVACGSANDSPLALLPPVAKVSPLLAQGEYDSLGGCDKVFGAKTDTSKNVRTDSIGAESSTATDSTGVNSVRGSEFSTISETSTRATTPESSSSTGASTPLLNTDLARSQLSLVSTSGSELLLSEAHAGELTFNESGRLTGGTLPALIERLTALDSTPDAQFVATFNLCFRLFTTPRQFAEALIERFDAVANMHSTAPVKLRVYNVFKGWMESHWHSNTDGEALDLIVLFADTRLKDPLPAASNRLKELAEKVSMSNGPLVPRLVSSIGKSPITEAPLRTPNISKGQSNALKAATNSGGAPVCILELDASEIARQLTLKESRIFCLIQPEEFLEQAWQKGDGRAANIKAMSSLSTDLATFVAETIMGFDESKQRALVIKHWIKVANKCFELDNYSTLTTIMCALNSSTILRLNHSWLHVSGKWRAVLDDLRSVIDISMNHASLRGRLRTQVGPCVPFLGIYLTDLIFVDLGNASQRRLSIDGTSAEVINLGKYSKTTKIISQIQGFQVPYRFAEVPEFHGWLDAHLKRINEDSMDVMKLYRRSLLLEPRAPKPAPNDRSPPLAPALQKQTSGLFSRLNFKLGVGHS